MDVTLKQQPQPLATAALAIWLKSSKASKRANPILPATRLKDREVVPRPHLQARLQRWPEPCAINSAWSYFQALEQADPLVGRAFEIGD